jgi:hypothetical protein
MTAVQNNVFYENLKERRLKTSNKEIIEREKLISLTYSMCTICMCRNITLDPNDMYN